MNKFKKIKKVLAEILVLNILVAVAKIIMGTIINSASMIADGYHSLTDGTSNVIGLIGVSIASKPNDDDHPYGHRKFETLTGLFIVAMLTFLGFKIITEAISKFSHPDIPNVNAMSLIVMVTTLIINIFVSTYEYRKGRELGSTILVSDSMHTRSDIFVTVGVIVTLVAIKLGAPAIIDPIASLVVAAFILHAAYEIFKEASSILVDSSAIDNEKIKAIVMKHEGVFDVHKIRSRGTIDNMFIDMHVQVDPNMKLVETHRISHEIEDAIRESLETQGVEVIVHMEPFQQEARD